MPIYIIYIYIGVQKRYLFNDKTSFRVKNNGSDNNLELTNITFRIEFIFIESF